MQLTKEEDVNEGFKMSMIKYFRKNGITDVTKAKAILRTVGNMPNDTVKKVFELGIDSNTIQSCSSLMGSPGTGLEAGYVRNRLQPKFDPNETGFYNLVCHRYLSTKDRGETVILGVIYEYNTGKVICHTLENEYYIKKNPAVHDGIHKITFGCKTLQNRHQGLAYYSLSRVAGKYGCGPKFGENTCLRNDGSGCAFHAGQHAGPVAKGQVRWTLGCVLIGSKANPKTGQRDKDAFFKCRKEYKSRAFINSTCPENVWIRNFYKVVIDAMESGLKPRIEYVTNYSQAPKIYEPTGITSTSLSSNIGGNTNGLVSLREALGKYTDYFEIIVPYATANNFTHNVIPGYMEGQNDVYASKTMAGAVVQAIEYMKGRHGTKFKLVIFDCFRPKEACKAMAKYARENGISTAYVADVVGDEPKSKHYRGAAIDVSLKLKDTTTNTYQYLNMGGNSKTNGGFDEFSKKARCDYKNTNQNTLRDIMTKGGLSPYEGEWWHFSYGNGVSGGDITYHK